MRSVLLLALLTSSACVSDESLFEAFSSVFKFNDAITSSRAGVMNEVFLQLEKLGVNRSLSICDLTDNQASLILMKAALAEYIVGLQEPGEWNIVVVDASTGKLKRERSFDAVRFNVLEGLLVISIAALGKALLK
jgi:hypothetical protein